MSVLWPRSSRAAPAIRSPVRGEQADEETISVFAHRDLDIGIGRYAQEALPNRDRLLSRIQSDLEYLFRPFELAYQLLELTLLLLSLACRRAQLPGTLAAFVHECRIGFSNCDHLCPLLRSQDGNAIHRPTYGRWPIDYTPLPRDIDTYVSADSDPRVGSVNECP